MDAAAKRPCPPLLAFIIDPSVAACDVLVTEWMATHRRDGLVVASAVFHPASLQAGCQARILLVKRAAGDAYPNVWETPGGCADVEPATTRVLHEAARELWEESGLRAKAALALVKRHVWTHESECEPKGKGNSSHGGHGHVTAGKTTRTEVWEKATFMFTVESTLGDDGREHAPVVLDPEEHQAHLWATEEDVRQDRCGHVAIKWGFAEQKDIVLAAFGILHARMGGALER